MPLGDYVRKPKRLRLVPLARQIIPLRIRRFHQPQPLGASPSLDLLLAFNRVAYIFEALEVDEPGHVVLRCKTRSQFQLMLPNPPSNAVGHAGVEPFRSVRHDVDEVASLFTHPTLHRLSSRAKLGCRCAVCKNQGPSLRSG